MENSGNIRYKFDKKGGGYVVVIASAINGGVDIPSVYNDGKNGEHPVVEIGNEAFALSDAEYVHIPESVVKISTDALYAYVAPENIFVDENNPVYKSIDGNLYSKDGESLIKYPQGKVDLSFTVPDGVTDICESAFDGCPHLKNVVISDNVRFIGANAFKWCSLEEAKFPTAYNWVLTSYIGGTPQNVGWLSADCLKNGKIAAKYLCEKYSGYMWTPVSEIPDDPEIKNLEIIKKRDKKI